VAVPTNEKARLAGPTRPLGSPDIPQFHLPAGAGGKGVYVPRLYGAAAIRFADRKRHFEERRHVAFLLPLDAGARTVDWDAAQPTSVTRTDLLEGPPVEAGYLPLPSGAMKVETFRRWARNFDRWLARTQRAQFTTTHEPVETVSIGPKRGGVSVELVAIVWELT
jgi:hypothetical protein